MKRYYVIFVLDSNLEENNLEYSQVIDWCYENLSNPNVMVLNEDDVYFIQYKTLILDIINEENESMIQEGEDDWIFSEQVKQSIKKRLELYRNEDLCKRELDILNSLIDLINISILTKKNLYFHW